MGVLGFSIISPVFNRAFSIGEAIQSLHAQTYSVWQHVVIDGGSTDETLNVINQFPSGQRILISEPDQGIYDALNKGFALATGEVIGILHSDDLLANDRVLEQVAAAFSEPSVDAVFGDLEYVAAGDVTRVIRYWRSGECSRGRLAWGWMPPHPALFLRRRVIEQFGGYDTRYRISADYDAILRYFWGGNIMSVYIPSVLVRMRVGGESNRSLSRILRKSWEDHLILRRNRVGGLGALAWKNFSKVGQFFRMV